jgi:CubicO group peptidase (beta-lactamase class C family)|tara:strand:- start:1051 stop:1743 length:693 start_codon:yes stop_codon:yes gene_type:complete
MLGLGTGICANTYPGGWLPSDESTLEAWYRYNKGITLNGSKVSQWADSSSNSFDMAQSDTGEQPDFENGILTFDPATDTENLQSSSSIELDGEFIVGFVIDPVVHNVIVIGSNSVPNEFVKLQTASLFRVKNDSSGNVDYTLEAGHDTKDAAYWVLLRDGSDDLYVYKDGLLQDSAKSVAGTFDINAIGVRRTDQNAYKGTVKEITIFKGTSDLKLRDRLLKRLRDINSI